MKTFFELSLILLLLVLVQKPFNDFQKEKTDWRADSAQVDDFQTQMLNDMVKNKGKEKLSGVFYDSQKRTFHFTEPQIVN